MEFNIYDLIDLAYQKRNCTNCLHFMCDVLDDLLQDYYYCHKITIDLDKNEYKNFSCKYWEAKE